MAEPLDPRVALANERTLLSWIRLALALVAAGTTIGTVANIKPTWLHLAVAIVPIVLGLVAARSATGAGSASTRPCGRASALPPDRELRLVSVAVALIAVIAGAAAVVAIFSR